MNVLVVREYPHGRDINFVMIARTDTVNMVSRVMRLENKANVKNGNPYSIYGDHVAEFTGCDKLKCNITVAECTSGDLERWKTF